jgi:hypothetical protein
MNFLNRSCPRGYKKHIVLTEPGYRWMVELNVQRKKKPPLISLVILVLSHACVAPCSVNRRPFVAMNITVVLELTKPSISPTKKKSLTSGTTRTRRCRASNRCCLNWHFDSQNWWIWPREWDIRWVWSNRFCLVQYSWIDLWLLLTLWQHIIGNMW